METKTGFLQLAAELRNEIYSYLIEDIDTNVGSKTIRLRPRADFSKHWRKTNPHRGNHYSLNQVCRLTRHEFGPLYVSQVTHRVLVNEQISQQTFELFLQSLNLGKEAKGHFALTPKNIEIELAYSFRGSIKRLDVTKLIKFYLSTSDLQCTFSNKFGPMSELKELFWDYSKAWKDAIEQDLHKIMLWPPNGSKTTVELVFRDDAKQDFIGDVPTGRPKKAPPSVHGYLKEVGAVDFGIWDARVDVWNTHANVEFLVSKITGDAPNQDKKEKQKIFETQYRLVEN